MTHRNFAGRDGQRHASGNARALPARAGSAGIRPSDDLDTLLALAREAGLLVTLDGQIGREKYQSVAGSVLALQRFAAALCARAADDAPAVSESRRKAPPRLAACEPAAQSHMRRVRTAACRAPTPASACTPRCRPPAHSAVHSSHPLAGTARGRVMAWLLQGLPRAAHVRRCHACREHPPARIDRVPWRAIPHGSIHDSSRGEKKSDGAGNAESGRGDSHPARPPRQRSAAYPRAREFRVGRCAMQCEARLLKRMGRRPTRRRSMPAFMRDCHYVCTTDRPRRRMLHEYLTRCARRF